MTDITAVARDKEQRGMKQFGLACVYTNCNGHKKSIYCRPPRFSRIGELDELSVEGLGRVTVITVAHADLSVDPEPDDEIEISEATSKEHCGTYRIGRVVPHKRIQCILIVR